MIATVMHQQQQSSLASSARPPPAPSPNSSRGESTLKSHVMKVKPMHPAIERNREKGVTISRAASNGTLSSMPKQMPVPHRSPIATEDYSFAMRLVGRSEVSLLASEWFALATHNQTAALEAKQAFMARLDKFLAGSVPSWTMRLLLPKEGQCSHFEECLQRSHLGEDAGCCAGSLLSAPCESAAMLSLDSMGLKAPTTMKWCSPGKQFSTDSGEGQDWGMHCNVFPSDKRPQLATWSAAIVRPDRSIATFSVIGRVSLGSVRCHTFSPQPVAGQKEEMTRAQKIRARINAQKTYSAVSSNSGTPTTDAKDMVHKTEDFELLPFRTGSSIASRMMAMCPSVNILAERLARSFPGKQILPMAGTLLLSNSSLGNAPLLVENDKSSTAEDVDLEENNGNSTRRGSSSCLSDEEEDAESKQSQASFAHALDHTFEHDGVETEFEDQPVERQDQQSGNVCASLLGEGQGESPMSGDKRVTNPCADEGCPDAKKSSPERLEEDDDGLSAKD